MEDVLLKSVIFPYVWRLLGHPVVSHDTVNPKGLPKCDAGFAEVILSFIKNHLLK